MAHRNGCYVDTVRSYPTPGCGSREFCHLLADTREELHAMADALGMPRRFFQDHPWRWHHDLPEHLRADAVELGAPRGDHARGGRAAARSSGEAPGRCLMS